MATPAQATVAAGYAGPSRRDTRLSAIAPAAGAEMTTGPVDGRPPWKLRILGLLTEESDTWWPSAATPPSARFACGRATTSTRSTISSTASSMPWQGGPGALAYAGEDRGARVQGRPMREGYSMDDVDDWLDDAAGELRRLRSATAARQAAKPAEQVRAEQTFEQPYPQPFEQPSPGPCLRAVHESEPSTNMPVCRPLPLPPPWPSRLPPWHRRLRHPLRRMRGSSPSRPTTSRSGRRWNQTPGPSPRCPPRRPG